MMDLSDGLATDLPRLAEASGCGFDVRLDALPLSAALRRFVSRSVASGEQQTETATERRESRCQANQPAHDNDAVAFALNGGEDYELLFTTACPESEWRAAVSRAAGGRALRVTRIGEATVRKGTVRFLDAQGGVVAPAGQPFEHY
jgi:thiamine monophosphate kinase